MSVKNTEERKEDYMVSVVIPTYNRSALLRKALESLWRQTVQDFEVIVVDDCSEDDTAEMLKEYANQRLVYIRHETNQGGSKARNTGIRAASGKFIAFLDSDDQWEPVKLEKQLELFEADDETGAVYTGLSIVQQERIMERIVPHFKGDILNELLKENCIDTTSSILVKKNLLFDIGGFDERLRSCQDWDLYIRLARITKFDCTGEAHVLFNQHSGERITSNPSSVVSGHLAVYEKHKEFAKSRSRKVFSNFNLTVAEVVMKTAYFHHSRSIMKLSREVLAEALKNGISSPRRFLLIGVTYMPFAALDRVYRIKKGAGFRKAGQPPGENIIN